MTENKENKDVNNNKTKTNKRYKTKKKFTSSYTEVNPAKALTLKNIELQHWMNEMNNDVRRDADQNNEMRTHRKCKTIENYRCEDYLRHSSADSITFNNKIAIKQSQTRHRNGP